MDSGGTEDLAERAAERVREVIPRPSAAAEIRADAERIAAQIRDKAEAGAASIAERAEADARERIEAIKRALETPGPPTPDPTPPSRRRRRNRRRLRRPSLNRRRSPSRRRPRPSLRRRRRSRRQPTFSTNGAGGEQAVRLVAMKMAIDGSSKDEIAAELTTKFGSADRAALLDEVFSRAGR